MAGQSGTIFAYGQTGAGKTYTILGENNESQRGILIRSIENIFRLKSDLKSVAISFYEIYNDKIYDLFSKKNFKKAKKSKKLDKPEIPDGLIL